jgi:hypothetical protein
MARVSMEEGRGRKLDGVCSRGIGGDGSAMTLPRGLCENKSRSSGKITAGMWREDGERRWLRLRVSVFVLAVCTLLTAWWRYSDSHVIPTFFYPIDAFLGQPPGGVRPAIPVATADGAAHSVHGAGADGPATVGTSGRGASAKGPDDRAKASDPSNAIVVQPRLAFDPPRAAPRTRNEPPPSRAVPCDPDRESQPQPNDARQARDGAPPCEPQSAAGRAARAATRAGHAAESAGPKR